MLDLEIEAKNWMKKNSITPTTERITTLTISFGLQMFILVMVLAAFFYAVSLSNTPTPSRVEDSVVPVATTAIPTPTVSPSPHVTVPRTITVYTDSDYGFYKIRGMDKGTLSTISINVGDTVKWVNDDDNWDLAINGFFGTHKLRYSYQYTFTEPGTFTIDVKSKRNNAITITVI